MDNVPQNQKNPPARITWKLIWTDLLNVLNFEKGIFFTIKGLIISPKQTVDDYLYGNRSLHANPIRFLIFSTAVVTLLNFYFVFQPAMDNGSFVGNEKGTMFNLGKSFGKSVSVSMNDDAIEKVRTSISDVKTKKNKISEKQKEDILKNVLTTLFSWMDKLTFAMVPVFALFSFLLFRKTGYNYTENLVINAFMISVTNVLGILVMPIIIVRTIWGGSLLSVAIFIFMIYFMFRVFASGSIGSFFRVIINYIVSYLFFILAVLGILTLLILSSISDGNIG